MYALQRYRKYAPIFLLGILGVFVAGVWVAVYAQTPSGVLTVAVLDVGQGDSLYIESPTGVQVVIDAGPDNALLRELPQVMPPFDRSLDAAIETHPDADHIAGFVDLLKRYTVGAFVEPGIVKTSKTALLLEQEIIDEHIPRYLARRGMTLNLGGGAILQILYPDHDVTYTNKNATNDGGIVARLVYGSSTILFMADVSQKVEDKLLLLEGGQLKSDLLKVGHHGSKTSSAEAFLGSVQPEVALISVGARNTYRHPTPEALGRLTAVGAEILRTDQEGTIVFKSDGKTFWRVR